ncbi:acetyl-CoA acetyltransferase [Desulfofundulus luciae]|uniref:Acetyl-CoA acetyltransferase n=1 Tax=Desulfofundulus luciae TaxID=74702 RepID=A0ABU0B4Y4_9FIRM|nr:thiolase family protein [Desulfofundulus luciae]MDQ0287317.1 acetyl-CoA acetyltransferase [Desulfofundulus luciae]
MDMDRDFLKKRRACLVGIGETEQGKVPGKSSLQFHSEAAKLAIEDAGIRKEDINGVITAFSFVDQTFMHCTTFAEYFGIAPQFYYTSMAIGGSTAAWMLAQAAMAIHAGLADVILCVRGDNTLTGLTSEGMIALIKEMSHIELEYPYGLLTPGGYALFAQRHMHEFGTKSEQLAAIAVAMRKHAALMPNAFKKEPITIEDVLNSPMIASPLHLLDCCLVTDGGGAFIVASEEKARNMKHKPVYIKGVAQESTHQYISQAPNLRELLMTYRKAADKAFAMAGIQRKDIDVAMIYDCFTITVLMSLEGLGFCEIGEGGSFVEGGRIELGGELPVNTHGGLLSQAHLGGMFHVNEAVRQLRGEAGPRQVPGASHAVVTGNGGLFSSQSIVILGNEP